MVHLEDYLIYQVEEVSQVIILNLQILDHMVILIRIQNQDKSLVEEVLDLMESINMSVWEEEPKVTILTIMFIKRIVKEHKVVLVHLDQV